MDKVLKFYAPWCAPCTQMSKQIERLKDELGNVTIEEVNIDTDPQLAALHKIRSLPTLIRLSIGDVESVRVAGIMSDVKLLEFLT